MEKHDTWLSICKITAITISVFALIACSSPERTIIKAYQDAYSDIEPALAGAGECSDKIDQVANWVIEFERSVETLNRTRNRISIEYRSLPTDHPIVRELDARALDQHYQRVTSIEQRYLDNTGWHRNQLEYCEPFYEGQVHQDFCIYVAAYAYWASESGIPPDLWNLGAFDYCRVISPDFLANAKENFEILGNLHPSLRIR